MECSITKGWTLCLLDQLVTSTLFACHLKTSKIKYVWSLSMATCTYMRFLSNTTQNYILDHQSQEWSLSVQRCPSVGVRVPKSYPLQSEVRFYCWMRMTDPVSQHSPGSLTEAKRDRSHKLSRCFMVLVDWGWGNWCSSGPKFTLCRFRNRILPRNELNGGTRFLLKKAKGQEVYSKPRLTKYHVKEPK